MRLQSRGRFPAGSGLSGYAKVSHVPAHTVKGLVLSLIGVAIGTFTAVLLTRSMRAFLYGVQPLDMKTFAVVIALLVGVAALSSYLPARRAAATGPMVALRAD